MYHWDTGFNAKEYKIKFIKMAVRIVRTAIFFGVNQNDFLFLRKRIINIDRLSFKIYIGTKR